MILTILCCYFGIALLYFLYCEAHEWYRYFVRGTIDHKFPITHSGTHTLYLCLSLLWLPLLILLTKCHIEQLWEKRHGR